MSISSNNVGGSRSGNQGYFFEPTVVTDLPDDSKLMTQEPFGPIAPIVHFKTFDEVVARANSLKFGLAAYAFTSSTKTANAATNRPATLPATSVATYPTSRCRRARRRRSIGSASLHGGTRPRS